MMVMRMTVVMMVMTIVMMMVMMITGIAYPLHAH